MKNLLLVTTLLLSTLSFAQTEFNYTKEEALTPKGLVVETPNKTQSEIYQNALGWVKENFMNSDEVIQTTIENNMIRFKGITKNGYCVKVFGMNSCDDIAYLIDLEFKDGKYRFIPLSLKYYNKPTNGVPEILWGWRDFYLNDSSYYFKKKGEINSAGKNSIPFILETLDKLNSRLKSYIDSGSSNKLNADW